jgi:hypothetical protein
MKRIAQSAKAVGVACALAAQLVSGCGARKDIDPSGTRAPDQALVDSSDVAVAVGGDRRLVAWIGTTPQGMRQVVGQVFPVASNLPLGTPRIYAQGTNIKYHLSAASSGSRFIITYEDQFSAQDHDVWAIVTDDDGAPISRSSVNFDGAYDEAPSVIWVPGASGCGRWLVSYARATSSGWVLMTSWVDTAGGVSSPVTITTMDSGPVRDPRATFGDARKPLPGLPSDRRILFSWLRSNSPPGLGVGFVFANADTLALSSQHAVGGDVDGPSSRRASSTTAPRSPRSCGARLARVGARPPSSSG